MTKVEFRKKTENKDVFGVEQALAKIGLELLEPEAQKILTTSDLVPKEIFYFSTLLTLAEEIDSELIKIFTEYFLLLRVSRLRLGRKEFVLMLSGLQEAYEKKSKKTISDFFSMR